MRTESRTRLVYVAGKFSAHTREGVESNIRAAVAVGIEVAKLGAFPVVPHANTSHPEYERAQAYQFWIDGTLELLRRCDVVVMVPGWEASHGACGEHAEAHKLGIPVFDSLNAFAESIGRRSRPFSDAPAEEKRDTTPAPPPAPDPHAAPESERMCGAGRE